MRRPRSAGAAARAVVLSLVEGPNEASNRLARAEPQRTAAEAWTAGRGSDDPSNPHGIWSRKLATALIRSTTRRAAGFAARHNTRRMRANDSYFTGGGTM